MSQTDDLLKVRAEQVHELGQMFSQLQADYAKLQADNKALLDALTDFVSAAQSWHDFHKHTEGIQCDRLCACIPKARAAIEHSEPQ